MANEGMVIAVSPKLGVRIFKEFVEFTGRTPTPLAVGTNGPPSLPHSTARLIAEKAKLTLTIVPYATGGTNEAIRDVLGGRVQAVIEALPAMRGFLSSGELLPIAIMTERRLPTMPELGTATEIVPGLVSTGWVAMVLPARAPQTVVERIESAMRNALRDNKLMDRLQALGSPFEPLFGGELAAFIAQDQARWGVTSRQP